jgi:hypothetical protein
MKGNTYRNALLRLVESMIADEAAEQQRSAFRLALLRQAASDLQAGRRPAELSVHELRRRSERSSRLAA